MRIVHVNFSDSLGGAAIAVRRIHESLLKEGLDSWLVVSENIENLKNTCSNDKSFFGNTIVEIKKTLGRQLKFFFKTENKNTHSLNIIPSSLVEKINKLKPDIVNLHWIGNETISISDIVRIKSKIVWTLHDMWPFCGAEHYTNNDRYIFAYTKFNKPNTDIGIDVNRFIFNKKKKYYSHIKKIICSSDWLYNCAKESFLFGKKEIKKIPLLIDQDFWKPFDRNLAKYFLNINKDQKLILFGAENFVTNKRKGFDLLNLILEKFQSSSDYKIALFGVNKNIDFHHINKNIVNLGLIRDEYTLRLAYSASDVVVIPSLIEAFGQVAYEAIHCGSPCVVFENTGLTSIIKHKINGYISKTNDREDFTNGIHWCLNNQHLSQDIIYKEALKKFNTKNIISSYIDFISK